MKTIITIILIGLVLSGCSQQEFDKNEYRILRYKRNQLMGCYNELLKCENNCMGKPSYDQKCFDKCDTNYDLCLIPLNEED